MISRRKLLLNPNPSRVLHKETRMNLIDLVNRPAHPQPWSEGDNIPWNDPAFSERMLREHLIHHTASRSTEKIDQQVAWIHRTVLSGRPTHILDLGCGPGLYAMRFARLGHACKGIDFSPASIRYATEQAAQEKLACAFTQQDVRRAEFGAGYGMAMFIYGEFNVFKPEDAKLILRKAHAALVPGGTLLLEPSTFAAIERMGHEPPTWSTAQSGLFGDQPYMYLQEHRWDPASRTATTRHFVLDAATAQVTRYSASYQAYTSDDLRALLQACGFGEVCFYPSLMGVEDPSQPELPAVTARKGE
jgi:ubiquinone/menaquinone biosynthesis C-methylase UbiE